MLASPPELPSTGSLRLETSHLRRCSYSSRQHWCLVRAVMYGINKLPLKDAKFVDVQQRAECGVEDAVYFVDMQGFPHFPGFQHIEYFVKFNFDHGHKTNLVLYTWCSF